MSCFDLMWNTSMGNRGGGGGSQNAGVLVVPVVTSLVMIHHNVACVVGFNFIFILSQSQTPHQVVYLKPPMADKDVWTHEPQHDYSLHVRVFKPEGLTVRETKCVLTFGDQLHKTPVLDPLPGTPVSNTFTMETLLKDHLSEWSYMGGGQPWWGNKHHL